MFWERVLCLLCRGREGEREGEREGHEEEEEEEDGARWFA